MGVWFLVVALFITELLAYTWCRVQDVRLGYEIEAMGKEGRELIQLHKKMTAELTQRKSLPLMAGMASQLGLGPPSPEQQIALP